MSSPYDGLGGDQWKVKTEELIAAHPLDMKEVVEVTLGCWDAILATRIGGKAQIGVHIFPRPQVMGMFLHELIPLEFSDRYPTSWRREQEVSEKDLVCLTNPSFSVEIKTSSDKSQIFGNRSYAQPTSSTKKGKSGYYLAVNFDKFTKSNKQPGIRRICFGWLDGTDWVGQKAPSGQQARLLRNIYGSKLLCIHPA